MTMLSMVKECWLKNVTAYFILFPDDQKDLQVKNCFGIVLEAIYFSFYNMILLKFGTRYKK